MKSQASANKIKLVGTKKFYSKVFHVMVPIIVQGLITSFVSLLDNIMVGSVGTEQMSGVSIANQLMFIYMLAMFGALSGIGIFTAQLLGARNQDGVRQTIRAKFYISAILLVVFNLACVWKGRDLIGLFLTANDDKASVELTLESGMTYLRIMQIGLIPFAISDVMASTLREAGETRLPMVGSIAAVCINLILNYILIYGNLGAPALGVAGAAIATVISRFAECAVIMIVSLRHPEHYPYWTHLFSSWGISRPLLKDMLRRGTPLLVNEFLWSLAVSAVQQSYSTRGIVAIAAVNICSTVSNLFSQMYLSFGTGISIIIGQLLGAGKNDQAKQEDTQLIVFSVAVSSVMGVICWFIAPLFPRLYNTSDEVRNIAAILIRITGMVMPLQCLVNSCYYTMRCGGKTVITFLFDSCFMLAVSFPVSYALSRFTEIPVTYLYAVIQCLDLIKAVIGLVLVHKNVWINNITASAKPVKTDPQAVLSS